MTSQALKELRDKKLITSEQYNQLEPIYSRKIVSVFYELRTLLYLGVMLFTTGASILIYQNIGDIGHLVLLGLLTAIMVACFWYVVRSGLPYSPDQVQSPIPYYDYVVLLGCLLFISIQGYLQFQYELFTERLSLNTLITAAFFFYAAYRFDHLAVLSLAITALASFFSISTSPQKWYENEFFSGSHLHLTAIFFGVGLTTVAWFLDRRGIKKHFTFTYHNFALLIYFCGCIAGLFVDEAVYGIYVLLIYAGCYFCWVQARSRKSFLFLLYGFLAGYIATTVVLADIVLNSEPVLWFWYSLLSCAGFIYFIIRYRTIFKRT